jgi:plastocyanin
MNLDNKTIAILWMVAAILFIATLIYFSPQGPTALFTTSVSDTAESIREGTAPIPPFTDEIKARVENSNGFSALVSYTQLGFEPREVNIKKGDTIRFTNNSGEDLWVAATGESGRVYPYSDRADGCGSSDFDSCKPFGPQDFWEFTFAESGIWSFVNRADGTKSGEVMVRVE